MKETFEIRSIEHAKSLNDGKVVILGLIAVIKLVINIGVGLMDFIPYIGAIFSWSADAWKYIAPHVGKKLRAEYGIDLDLTSGVSKTTAVGSEALELLGVGFVPTHFIESGLWFKREGYGQIRDAYRVLKTRPPKFLPDRFPL